MAMKGKRDKYDFCLGLTRLNDENISNRLLTEGLIEVHT